MARRTTSLSKKTNATRKAEPAQVASEPVKARRGRKPKMQLGSEADTPDPIVAALSAAQAESDDPPEMMVRDDGAAPPEPASPRRRGRQKQSAARSATNTGSAPDRVAAAPTPSAAQWDAATGTARFDWPSIESVAATEGPNQALAKLLLAARAEGANSRWPF